MNNPSNPFNPNSIVTPTLFAGRSQQVVNVLKKLSNVREGQHASFILHGERGIGKTALAKLIRDKEDKQFFKDQIVSSLTNLIHSAVGKNEDDGLCNDMDNWPEVKSGDTTNDHERSACILGVYCKVVNDENIRKSVAEIVDDNNVERLVKFQSTEGGLALNDDDEDGEEWTDKACSKGSGNTTVGLKSKYDGGIGGVAN